MRRWAVAVGLAVVLASGVVGIRSLDAQPGPMTAPADDGGSSVVFPARNADGSRPASIAFVCDASGSMMAKLPVLHHELQRAIRDLRPDQQFSITILQDAAPAVLDGQLLPATPENKKKADDFIQMIGTKGTTDPIPALRLAMSQHPQVMYFLTDGDFPDNQQVLTEIQRLDPDHKIRINTIAFTDQADHDEDFKKILKRIATAYGGVYTHVDADHIQEPDPATQP